MSLATLKKKTKNQYNNLSVNKKQFSLNGTHRSQGFIGQTMLSRHFPATLMRGNVARGHGGCCGTYNNANGHIIKSTGIPDLNNNNIVKNSVLNTLGYYHTHYKWIWGANTTVKNMSYNKINNQQAYIDSLAKNTIACIVTKPPGKIDCSTINTVCKYNRPFGSVIKNPRGYAVISKPSSDFTSKSQGDFIKALAGTCAPYNKEVPRNPSANLPLPGK